MARVHDQILGNTKKIVFGLRYSRYTNQPIYHSFLLNSSIKHKVKKEIAKAATEVLFFYHAISKTWLYQYCEEMLNFYPGNHHPPDWPGLLPSFGLCSHIVEKNVCLLVFPVL